MLLFVNDGMQINKSGIEFAQIQRLNLFKQYHEPAMIVTRQYSNELHYIIQESGIDEEHFVNMFDYFQHARLVDAHPVVADDIQVNPNWQKKIDGQNIVYSQDGSIVLIIRCKSKDDPTVLNLQTFDHFGKLLKITWYDTRGFVSVEHLFDWKNKVEAENYFTPDGKLAIQKTTLLNKQGAKVENYHLFDYKGADYQFAGLDEFTRFFLDELVADKAICGDGPVGIIVDRNFENAWSVLHMHTRVPRYMQLHSIQVNDASDIMNSTFNYNYEWGFHHLTDWDGIIALTPQQEVDVRLRFGKYGVPIFHVPSAVVSDEQINAPHVPFANRKKHKVVVVARLSPEKQQEHIIAAWPQILKAVPDATLDLWGYANDAYDVKLRKQIKKLGLEDSVSLKGFTSNIAKVDDEAQLMVLPTSSEGLAIALVEAEAHGLPMVANDVKYGPGDIIIDSRDGLLTKNGDIDGLATAVIKLLTDEKKLAEMSKNAYEDSKRYSGPVVMKLWQKVIDDVKDKGANK
ncbi:glycosyltransferase [Limosilactobacillus oris]|uniref:glycosyltransferase n=1 Tax=Limosilactobacillus oris TaxID=1632 RepID=UPI0024B3ADCB|nr:glycosyltransferase [Limosilactobacillus oris]WHO85868.1 glycosyltransferase [Limosilactobacillus oris]